jgi:hypothetical protein
MCPLHLRRRLAVASCAVASAIAQAPVLVQQATSSGTLLAGLNVALPQLPAPGDLLVVCHDTTAGGNSSVSGGGVSHWTLCQSTVPTQDNSEIWAGLVDGAPDISIQITLGGSPNDAAAVVTEWRGLLAPLSFTGAFATGSGGTAASPAQSGTVAANAGDLVVAMVGTHSTGQVIGAPANGFADLQRPASQPSCVMAAAAGMAGAGGAIGTSWTFPNPSVWAGVIVVFPGAHPGTFGGSGDDTCSQIRIDPASGNWAVAGRTASFGRASDFLLVRFDTNGNLLSTMAWGGARDEEVRGMDLHVGSAPGIYLAGASNSFGTGASDRDVVLVRCDLDGNLQWGARWSSNNNLDEHGEAVCVDNAGDAFVAGTIHTSNRLDDVLLLKFSPVASGALPTVAPAVATWGGTGDDRINGAAIDKTPVDPRLYLVGSTTSFGNGNKDVLVQRFGSTLALQWTRTWGGSGQDEGVAACVDAQGNLYVAGSTQTGAAATDALLLKWDPSGNLLWRVTFGGSAADSLRNVLVDCNGSVLVTGTTASAGAGQQDGLLARFDADGNLFWAQTWGTAQADDLGGSAVAACADIAIAGSSPGSAGLALWTPPTVSRSVSTSQVTSPTQSLGSPPSGQLHLPTLPVASGPGAPAGLDVRVQRLTGATATIAAGCAAAPASTGGPVLAFDNAPVLGGTLQVRRTSAQPAPLTVLAIGFQGQPQPLSAFGGTVPGGSLCIALLPSTVFLFFGGTSPTVFSLPLQQLRGLVGQTLDVQWIDLLELGNSAVGHIRAGW